MTFDDLTALLQDRYPDRSREVSARHWMCEVLTEERRSQVVHLLYKAKRAHERDVSRIILNSPIGPLPKRYDAAQLLRRNAELDGGAICIEDFRDEENQLVAYLTLRAAHRADWTDGDRIIETLEWLARAADQLERDIYAHDVR